MPLFKILRHTTLKAWQNFMMLYARCVGQSLSMMMTLGRDVRMMRMVEVKLNPSIDDAERWRAT